MVTRVCGLCGREEMCGVEIVQVVTFPMGEGEAELLRSNFTKLFYVEVLLEIKDKS